MPIASGSTYQNDTLKFPLLASPGAPQPGKPRNGRIIAC
jgi:hypothetical protein